MRHKFLVLTVKKWLKSVYIYGSYRKIKTGVPLFWTTMYMERFTIGHTFPSSLLTFQQRLKIKNALIPSLLSRSYFLSVPVAQPTGGPGPYRNNVKI